SQSTALCDAYGGAELVRADALGAHFTCGAGGSELHVFNEAEHGLDVCIRSELGDVCPAGSAESQRAVAHAMRRAHHWLKTGEPGPELSLQQILDFISLY